MRSNSAANCAGSGPVYSTNSNPSVPIGLSHRSAISASTLRWPDVVGVTGAASPSGQRLLSSRPVALGAVHRALCGGALLAVLQRRQRRVGARWPGRAAPDFAVIGQRDGAAL